MLSTVLDEMYTRIPGDDDLKAMRIIAALNGLEDLYRSPQRRQRGHHGQWDPAINFCEPAPRYAYTYKYATVHANLLANALYDLGAARTLFQGGGPVSVLSLGSGPGSEILGICKLLDRLGQQTPVHVSTSDLCPAWELSWQCLSDAAATEFPVTSSFHTANLCDPDSADPLPVEDADLITCVYALSALHGQKEKTEAFFGRLCARMHSKAILLCIDGRNYPNTRWLSEIATGAGMQDIGTLDIPERVVLPSDEQRTDLGVHYLRLHGRCDPQLQAAPAVWAWSRTPPEQPAKPARNARAAAIPQDEDDGCYDVRRYNRRARA